MADPRQKPVLYCPPGTDGPYYRRWRAWGICTAEGVLAELTMDQAKAAVWIEGGHKVLPFVHDELIADDAQSNARAAHTAS